MCGRPRAATRWHALARMRRDWRCRAGGIALCRHYPVDLATNKLMAAAGRREPQDVVDLLTIHDRILPLGAVAWAVVGKQLGFTPEGLINEVRRQAHYTDADFRHLASDPSFDPAGIMARLRQLLQEAEEFVRQMPTAQAGLLFLQESQAVQPDPRRLDRYQAHAGQRRGQWPSSPEISTAMLGVYGNQGDP